MAGNHTELRFVDIKIIQNYTIIVCLSIERLSGGFNFIYTNFILFSNFSVSNNFAFKLNKKGFKVNTNVISRFKLTYDNQWHYFGD